MSKVIDYIDATFPDHRIRGSKKRRVRAAAEYDGAVHLEQVGQRWSGRRCLSNSHLQASRRGARSQELG